MKGYVRNIEEIAVRNEDFRQVLYTAKNCQLVIMALRPKEEIGMELHTLDQFFRVEEGTRETVMDGVQMKISAGSALLIPAGGTRCGPGRMLARREREKQGESAVFFGVFAAVLYTTAKTPF